MLKNYAHRGIPGWKEEDILILVGSIGMDFNNKIIGSIFGSKSSLEP